ncbi:MULTISPECIES: hypothetical protein [Streptomyces]|uniref:hypothetical protein n=1 Tax=Streptomyces TaxID=1883 RepID=UPI001E5A5889|nr:MULTISPECIES: hypothetical protein [Streptomyces]UFQ14582.1 hypothetical protein J2N69_05880 [Streptomyces huasconensis]WCL84183.1 hypothetical protein PPN52_05880 [Streptomyces sp. JCM 35825]
MTIKDVARHEVSEPRIEEALENIRRRAHHRWHTMRYDCYSDEEMQALRDDLLDHVAARTVADAEPGTAPSDVVLRTAAECALGLLSLGCYPNGDQEISFSLIDEELSSEDTDFEARRASAPPLAVGNAVQAECRRAHRRAASAPEAKPSAGG